MVPFTLLGALPSPASVSRITFMPWMIRPQQSLCWSLPRFVIRQLWIGAEPALPARVSPRASLRLRLLTLFGRGYFQDLLLLVDGVGVCGVEGFESTGYFTGCCGAAGAGLAGTRMANVPGVFQTHSVVIFPL
jgi:hypothetical protein